MTFRGDRLREARLAVKAATKGKKGSQSWLAHATGAHVTSISDWERGANEPSSRYLPLLAAAVDIPVQELLTDEDDAEAASMQPLGRDIGELFTALVNRAVDAKLAERERVA